MKIGPTTNYLLQKQLKIFGLAYIYSFAFLIVLPFLLYLLSGDISAYSFSNALVDTPISGIFYIYMIVISLLSYENFKFLIQNGISRKTFFISQLKVYLIIGLIGNIINQIYNYLIVYPLNMDTFKSLSLFQSIYENTFSNPFLNGVLGFVFGYLMIMSYSLTSMAIGSFLSLFSRKMQRAIIIMIPIAGVITLVFLVKLVIDHQFIDTWMADFAKWLLGYANDDLTTAKPYHLMVWCFGWDLIMLYLSKVFYSKKQIKKA